MAVAIRIDWDADGRLTAGRMEVLPACATTSRRSSPGAWDTGGT